MHMEARQKKAIMRHVLRMFICTVVCLFALSAMRVTAYAADAGDGTVGTTASPSDIPAESGEGDTTPGEGNTTPGEGDTAPGEGDTTPGEGDTAPG